MHRANAGFTLIEIIVTIVVLTLLLSIAFISYTKLQADSRDGRRIGHITTLSDALEKAYNKNGEYPSCNAMRQTATTIAATLGVEASIFVAPRAPTGTTNSITCTALSGTADAYAYVGDGSARCTSTACSRFTLQYREESSGNIKSINSRH